MLTDLTVENLLLIERAQLRLAEGLNVLTGETGAGKTMLAHALDLLLGGRARRNIVRPGAAEAYVEGCFELTGALRERLADRLAPDADQLVLARRVGADGRTRAACNGRAISVGELRELACGLLTFYGQHEHRRLTLASAQLEVLDDFCGADQVRLRASCAAAHARSRELAGRVEELRQAEGSREREIDLLRFELEEIDAAAPDPAQERGLLEERARLAAAAQLAAAAVAGAEALAPESASGGAAAALAEAAGRAEALGGIDSRLDELAERLRALAYEADDVASELRRYEADVESAPVRLEVVEERLGVLGHLKRKHGGSLEAVLAHAEDCRARLAQLDRCEAALGEAEAELSAVRAQLAGLAAQLTAARRRAAPELAEAVSRRLGELAMEGARFEVELMARDEPGPAGLEGVEFVIAANPGVAGGPLREIASGGELSRVMLALMGVAVAASEAGSTAGRALLVFDEVDAGIGGHTARAVGTRLRELADGHQVLCITHLPQVASLAERHFRVSKEGTASVARASVSLLEGREVEGELVRMLGAGEGDMAARRHARELLRAA